MMTTPQIREAVAHLLVEVVATKTFLVQTEA
jgi:hypothetical protein